MKKILSFGFLQGFAKSGFKFDVAAQNRKDIYDQLAKCYTLTDLHNLQVVLCWCVSDFPTSEFEELLQRFEGRAELIKYAQKNFDCAVYKTSEVEAAYKTADYKGCYALSMFLQQTAGFYTAHQLMLFDMMFAKRLCEVTGRAKYHTE